MSDKELRLEVRGRKGSKLTLAVSLEDATLDVAALNITNAREREALINRLTKMYPAIDTDTLQKELISIADACTREKPEPPEEVDTDPSLSPRTVRPHLFHVPEASGLLTWRYALRSGYPTSQWVLCLQWADGRRECLEFQDSLSLPNGEQIWFQPKPGFPPTDASPSWSPRGRQAWLNGYTPNAAEVFRELARIIAYYLDFPEEKATGYTATLALWVILTYVFPIWKAVPYLWVNGPVGSGKTRVFEVLYPLVFRPLSSSNMSVACLFRTLHEQGGTLLLDEAERLWDKTPDAGEMRSILHSGYKAGSPVFRLEKAGEGFVSRAFHVFGPKALAGVNNLSPALSSRCIRIMMFRAGPDSPKPRRRLSEADEKLSKLRDDLHALALTHANELIRLASRTDLCEAMDGRDFEVWQPIHGIAKLVESQGAQGLLRLIQSHASSCIHEARDEAIPSADETVLRLLAEAICSGAQGVLTPGKLLERAKEEDLVTFQRWTAATVGRILKRYGIHSTPGRQRTYRDVEKAALLKIEQHYGAELGLSLEEPSHPSSSVISGDDSTS